MKYLVLLFAINVFSLDSIPALTTYVDSTIIEASDFNNDNDTLLNWSGRFRDSIDLNFMRFLDFNSGDSTLDSLKANYVVSTDINSATGTFSGAVDGFIFDAIAYFANGSSTSGLYLGSGNQASLIVSDSTYMVFDGTTFGDIIFTTRLGNGTFQADANRDIVFRAGIGGSAGRFILMSSQSSSAEDSVLKVSGRIVADSILVHGDLTADSIHGAFDFTGPISGTIATYDTVITEVLRADTVRAGTLDPVVLFSKGADILSLISPFVNNQMALNFYNNSTTRTGRIVSGGAAKTMAISVNEADAITIDSFQVVTIADALYAGERGTDPDAPAEGMCVIWQSNGAGKGDDGDVLMASTIDGATKYSIVFDHSAGTPW